MVPIALYYYCLGLSDPAVPANLRRARSCSSQSIRGCTQLSVATCVQCASRASRPLTLSTLARACKASRSFIGWLLELVIGFETVRGDEPGKYPARSPRQG